MGLVKLPRIAQYWRRDWVMSGPPVFCKEIMSRDRFFSILKFLRFSPPENVKKDDPRTRIEPFLSLLREKCKAVISPGKHVAVDEALVIWNGRLGFRQYIKTKRAKYGIKVFVLCPCDPNWQGYSWNYEVYYGKNLYQLDDPRVNSLSKFEKIVVSLMRQLLDEGRHIVTDKWYTSLRLAHYLEERNTTITGVVRNGKGPPKDIVQFPLEKRQSIFARKRNVLVVRWEDKENITVLTTKYNASMVEKEREYFSNRIVFRNKPLHIERYNKKMGSIDKADQHLEPCDINYKSFIWFKKLGMHFIFRSALNAYVAWKNTSNKKTGFIEFLESVVKDLLREYDQGSNKFLKEQESLASDTHQFIRWEKIGKRKKCRVCYPKRRDTVYFCPACPGEPGLCSMTHYNQYHGIKSTSSSKMTEEGSEGPTVTAGSDNPSEHNDEPTPSTSDDRGDGSKKRCKKARKNKNVKRRKQYPDESGL
ncbi:piggyBac transposable element-derived protein 4-like [Portunus trituberculatus]|nr:piggyBac transposable element-derived protein 4-like [Portunus trituberculatus]